MKIGKTKANQITEISIQLTFQSGINMLTLHYCPFNTCLLL